jgi:predicted methyltransferase
MLLTVALASCGQSSDRGHSLADTGVDAADASTTLASVYASAVSSEARLDGDHDRDEGRKPAEVLAFIGIKPGMSVLDMFAGGGYYTEIIASVVGDSGHVIAQTNEAYVAFVGDEFERRFGNNRLANVDVLMAENNELELAAESLDAVMLVLSYHDLYSANPEQGWPQIDVPAFLAELFQALKPAGVVGIVDHHAAEGSPAETGNTTHRIDPAIVIEDMAAAGFVFEAQSQLLRNPDDDYDKIVFAPELRGKTDRFLLRFRKPE